MSEFRSARLFGVRARQEILPPDKAIAFNARLDRSDGLLAHEVSRVQKLPYEQAEELVRQFADRSRKQLSQEGLLRFPGVGKLMQEDDGKIRFIPEERVNYLNESFGLATISLSAQERIIPGPVASPSGVALTLEVPVEVADTAAILPAEPEESNSPSKEMPVAAENWPAHYWWLAAASVLVIFGLFQWMNLSGNLSGFQMARWFGPKEQTVIEEGRALMLYPLIPSLQRQMMVFGPTTALTAVGPAVVLSLPDNTPSVLEPDAQSEETESSLTSAADSSPSTANVKTEAAIPPKSPKPSATEESASTTIPTKTTPRAESLSAAVLFNTQGPKPPAGYYLIVGSYPNPHDAEKRLNRIGDPIGQLAVLLGDNGMYRSGMFISTDKETTINSLESLRESLQQKDAWILRHRN